MPISSGLFWDSLLPSKGKKAFSTCSSHMIVVSLTYGTCIFIYMKSAEEGVALNKVVAVLATSVAPVMNSFIDSLRNTQVIQAFRDTFQRTVLISKLWEATDIQGKLVKENLNSFEFFPLGPMTQFYSLTNATLPPNPNFIAPLFSYLEILIDPLCF